MCACVLAQKSIDASSRYRPPSGLVNSALWIAWLRTMSCTPSAGQPTLNLSLSLAHHLREVNRSFVESVDHLLVQPRAHLYFISTMESLLEHSSSIPRVSHVWSHFEVWFWCRSAWSLRALESFLLFSTMSATNLGVIHYLMWNHLKTTCEMKGLRSGVDAGAEPVLAFYLCN